jgi:hypothetical protein
MPTYDVKTVAASMPNLDNLKKQAKQYLRWHRERYHPVAAEIRAALPRFRQGRGYRGQPLQAIALARVFTRTLETAQLKINEKKCRGEAHAFSRSPPLADRFPSPPQSAQRANRKGVQMAVGMPALRRTKSGSWSSRKAIPRDVQDAYRARYGVRHEAKFHASASCPRPTARMRHSEWQAEVDGRIAAIRAEQRGEGHDLTGREARALAGEWYRRHVNQHEEDPTRPRGWAELREILFLLLEDGGDPETLEIDMEASAVRRRGTPEAC